MRRACKMAREKAVYVKLFLHFFFDDHKAMQIRRVPNNVQNIKEFKAYIGQVCSISEDFDLRKTDGCFLFEDEEPTIISPEEVLIVVPVLRSSCRNCRSKRKAKGEETVGEQQLIDFSPENHSSVRHEKKKKRKRSSPDIIPREFTHRRINFFEDLSGAGKEDSQMVSGADDELIELAEKANNDTTKQESEKRDKNTARTRLIAHYTPANPLLPTNDFVSTKKVNLISNYLVPCIENNSQQNTLLTEAKEKDETKVAETTEDAVALSPRSSETTENGTATNTSDMNDTAPNEKRHRVRSRKKKKTKADIVDSPMPAQFIPRPLVLQGKPKLHVYFEESSTNCNAVQTSESQLNVSEEANQPKLFTAIKTIKPMSEQPINISRKVNNLNELRPNDVISFRKHKLLANFCPGVSNLIVARVESFYVSGRDDDEIHLHILEGLDEFAEPQGLLTNYDFDVDVANVKLQPKQILKWNQLFDLNLLNS